MRSEPRLKIRYIACLFALCGLILLLGCGKKLAQYQQASVHNNRIVIPLDEVKDGKAHFYTFTHGGRQINFFVRTDAKGKVSSFFDACYTCYRQKKGYRQEGTDLVCQECGMRFGLAEETWDPKGGCDPILLKSTIENNSLLVDISVIEKGGKLFR
ncbi:MAG: DUF2318 domain-containing protein [Nitrospirae bacterium]|nr:DUF2318 domain-containing protein [Nitrospirota bacterium]